MAGPAPIVLQSLAGGLNDFDPEIALPDDQCPIVQNIDFFQSTLGAKRAGKVAVTTTGATINSTVVFLHRHLPTTDETASQLWATSVSGTASIWNYKDTSWHAIVPTDALQVTTGIFAIRGQTLHGKLFLAYPLASGVDRLMVYDGATLRRTGLAEPAAPVVADSGSGAFATTRYYRVRYGVDSPALAKRLSEPSDATAFTPSGSGAGATVTKPAATGEGEQFWLVEESINNADFYQVASLIVATTTFTDTNTPDQVTGGTFPLAPPVESDSLQYSPKYLTADQDRLLIGGSWQQAPLASRVSWTPVYGTPAQDGYADTANDERLNQNEDPFIDLDNYDGGGLTDLGGPVNGYVYAFKWQRIYKLIRTGNVTQAYQAIKLTSAAGALSRSVISGVDELGRECLYFLDPSRGPMRIGASGLESCGEDIGGTWKRLDRNTDLPCHGVYYPLKRQVHWWIAVDGSGVPTIRIVANVRAFTPAQGGVKRGWAIYSNTPYENAFCSVMYADNINANLPRSMTFKPFVGYGLGFPPLIAITDSGTTDIGQQYQARIRTKPFAIGGMLMRPSIRAGALMAAAASGTTVYATLIRDFGKETGTPIAVSLTPEATETSVIKPIDNLALSDLLSVQVELGDTTVYDNTWELQMASFVVSPGETA